MTKNKTDEQAALNNEKEFSLDEYRRSMPYWKRVSYSFNSLRWIVMQQENSILQKDPEYQELRSAWDDETDPEIKEQLSLKLSKYKAKVRKEHNLPEEG